MLNALRITALLTSFVGISLQAEIRAPKPTPKPTLPEAREIELRAHCHAHLTPYGCEKHWACYWNSYQNRCEYK